MVSHIFPNNSGNNVLLIYVLNMLEKIIVEIKYKKIMLIHSLIEINLFQLNQNLFPIDQYLLLEGVIMVVLLVYSYDILMAIYV